MDRILTSLDKPEDVSAALGKLQGSDGFVHEGEMLEAFFRALATQWDGATFAQLERLMNRWASTLPPPPAGEAVLDIVSMLAKYGKKADGAHEDAALATARIVRELDKFADANPARQAQLDDLARGLVRHDKNYTDGRTRVDLNGLARNLEAGRNAGPGDRVGLLRDEVEAIYASTLLTNKDGYGGTNLTLFRRMEAEGAVDDEHLVNVLKSTLMDMDEAADSGAQGLPVVQLLTQNGRFIDVAVPRTTSSKVVTVVELDGGEAVTRPHEILADVFLAKEDKSYVLATWDATSIAAAHRQIAEGFEEGAARGLPAESLLVITEDILDTEAGGARLKQLLQKLEEPLGNYPGTGRVVVRPRRSVQKEVATGMSYNERVRDLLRSLVR